MARHSLLIATTNHADPLFSKLVAPEYDVRALEAVLKAHDIGGFDSVATLINRSSQDVREEIEGFFADRSRDDLLILYFSGHGVLDANGGLHFVTMSTKRKLLSATAIPAAFVTDQMNRCRSQRQLLLLDCCHSGAFDRTKGGTSVGTKQAFEGDGFGRVVLTATDATQFAWEDGTANVNPASVFTRCVVEGLQTGAADLDGDGQITVDELYDYTFKRVNESASRQTPGKWTYRQQGDMVVARNVKPVARQDLLSADLIAALVSTERWKRDGAIQELGRLTKDARPGVALAAKETLARFASEQDEILRLARSALVSARPNSGPTEPIHDHRAVTYATAPSEAIQAFAVSSITAPAPSIVEPADRNQPLVDQSPPERIARGSTMVMSNQFRISPSSLMEPSGDVPGGVSIHSFLDAPQPPAKSAAIDESAILASENTFGAPAAGGTTSPTVITPPEPTTQDGMFGWWRAVSAKSRRIALTASASCLISVVYAVLRPTKGALVVTLASSGVTALEDAKIYVDDLVVCESTPCLASNLKAGTHQLRATARNHEDTKNEPVEISAGGKVERRLTLLELAILSLLKGSPVDANVSIDQSSRGKLPLSLSLNPGKHVLRVSSGSSMYDPLEETLDLAPGEMRARLITLKPSAAAASALPLVVESPTKPHENSPTHRTRVQVPPTAVRDQGDMTGGGRSSFVLRPAPAPPLRPVEVDQLLSTARGSCSNELRDSDLADRVRMTVNVSTLGEVEVLLHDAFNKVPYGLCLKRVMEGTSLSRNAETYLVEKGFVLNR